MAARCTELDRLMSLALYRNNESMYLEVLVAATFYGIDIRCTCIQPYCYLAASHRYGIMQSYKTSVDLSFCRKFSLTRQALCNCSPAAVGDDYDQTESKGQRQFHGSM